MKLSGKAMILAGEIILVFSLVSLNLNIKKPSSEPVVLAEKTEVPTPIPTPVAKVSIRTESIEETTATPVPLLKSRYTIAFIGDSMIETMGAELPYVQKTLKEKYPNTSFSLYNYGIGSENVVEALSRFGLPYAYKDQAHGPITDLKADIIVVGSYSYNPITPFDKDEAWLLLSDLVGRAKDAALKVYILAEQAPLGEHFGEGIGGVNWPPEIAQPHADKIISGLENAVGLSEALNVGLINVFEESKAEGSKYGDPKYVAVHDGIHYSEEGQEFTAKIIAESIILE